MNSMQIVDLYKLTVGSTQFYFTSAQHDIEYDVIVWKTQPINHTGAIEQTNDPLKMDTSFDVQAGTTFADIALNPPANFPVKLEILRLENSKTAKSIFTGRIVSGTYSDGWVQVDIEPLYTELNTNGLYEGATRQCRYIVGSRKCGVTLNPLSTTVTSSEKTTVVVADTLPLDYQYGSLEVGDEAYSIDAQPDEHTLVLLHSVQIPTGTAVKLIKGCDGTMDICHSRFDNSLNFGGAKDLPVKNPYTGDPINR
ncbi:phage BR0599 family protein [Vibrio parahaemolyticus]|uniref:phage BR0599 family protein n=1 Tax=Vibrio parahaemolyticus TaxID=670 RepID=UPI0038919EDB